MMAKICRLKSVFRVKRWLRIGCTLAFLLSMIFFNKVRYKIPITRDLADKHETDTSVSVRDVFDTTTTAKPYSSSLVLNNMWNASVAHLKFTRAVNKPFEQDNTWKDDTNVKLTRTRAENNDSARIHTEKTDTFQQENPSVYLSSSRFDIMVKLVYAYFYAIVKVVPEPIKMAYTEHIRVWNKFHERCGINKKTWFDAKRPCKDKHNATDFLTSFHHTIDSIQKHGFLPNSSQIPVTNNGFILNGAHRTAAAIVLGKNVTFQHENYSLSYGWNYKFFKSKGFSTHFSNLMMLEWMKIQTNLPILAKKVSIVSIFSNDTGKHKKMRDIVRKNCSIDNNILYEHSIEVTKLGIGQLVTHMYGNQSWISIKIGHMLSKFKSDFLTVRFVFFFGKNNTELTKCKYHIRKLYNDRFFKSSAHIPDSMEESLIISEMVLNPNSVKFLNWANTGYDCQRIAREIADRSSFQPIKTLPGIYLGRDDVMVDSGSVLHFFGLRQRTDVDILFLYEVDEHILGIKNKVRIEAHEFRSNAISKGRYWGEDHFNKDVKTEWDLFYNETNYGFCYGIKYVSLEQLIRYKTKRNEKVKDPRDIKLISEFMGPFNKTKP